MTTNYKILNANYRILTEDRRIKFTGTILGSWFTLDQARSIVDRDSNEMIYEFNTNGDPMWEVL